MANYASAINAAALEPSVAFNMVGKVAKQIIKGVTGDNRLEELHRGTIENGETVEDVVFGLVEGSPLVDKVPGEPFSAPEATPSVKYFKNWNTVQYATGLTQRNLRKYLTTGTSVESIGGLVASQLAQSEKTADYEAIRDMFFGGELQSAMVHQGEVTSYKQLLKMIKDVVAGMKFTNTTFNAAGIKRRTLADDIRIIMPYKIWNALEVDELAGVFNLSKAEIAERVILVDSNVNKVFIFDKNAVQIWTRLYEMTEAFDAQQLRWNYFLTTDKMYGISPLYDVVSISYDIAAE